MKDFNKVSSKKDKVKRALLAVGLGLLVIVGYLVWAYFENKSFTPLPKSIQEQFITNMVVLTNTETVRVVETNKVAITNVKTNYKRVYVIEPAKDIQEVISNEERK